MSFDRDRASDVGAKRCLSLREQNISQRGAPERTPLHHEASGWTQRAAAARAIGELKRTADLPVYEPRREQDVFDRVRAANPGPLADAELLHVYERIMDVMRTLQRRDL